MVGKITGSVAILFAVSTMLSAQQSPALVAQSLLDADRHFAAAGAAVNVASALSPMLADDVIMPAPNGAFARGKPAVLAALQSTPDAADARLTWRPVRAGISADGQQGFTFGYMSQTRGGQSPVAYKYMAYWVHDAHGWRVAVYKRTRASAPSDDSTAMAPALPSRMMPVDRRAPVVNGFRQELIGNEAHFSAEAQRIGLGNAFAAFGSVDAVNMGGPALSGFVVGAEAIARHVSGGDMQSSPFVWSADTALVASSGDLGITLGVIHSKVAGSNTVSDANGGYSFFTIWRRERVGDAWRYVAE